MPFLEVLTRCYRRPKMLEVCQQSLARQTCRDFQHTFLVDDIGRGIAWSYENLAAYAPKLVGEWIWLLDDDDMCISDTLVADLKAIAVEHNPEVIMLRMNHGERGILPGKNWQKPPVQGDIGCSAFVVKRKVWQRHSGHLRAHYAGDYDFISSIFARDYEIYWHDCVASKVQRISLGAPE